MSHKKVTESFFGLMNWVTWSHGGGRNQDQLDKQVGRENNIKHKQICTEVCDLATLKEDGESLLGTNSVSWDSEFNSSRKLGYIPHNSTNLGMWLRKDSCWSTLGVEIHR